jgi:hypothetical protein
MNGLDREDLFDHEGFELELGVSRLQRVLIGLPDASDTISTDHDELPFVLEEFVMMGVVRLQLFFEGHKSPSGQGRYLVTLPIIDFPKTVA